MLVAGAGIGDWQQHQVNRTYDALERIDRSAFEMGLQAALVPAGAAAGAAQLLHGTPAIPIQDPHTWQKCVYKCEHQRIGSGTHAMT
jgi:hypothetical protein